MSKSSPPSPLPSPSLTGAEGASEGLSSSLGLALSLATGFFSPSSPRLVTANTVPPTTSSAATVAPMIIAGLPLKGFLEPPPPTGGGVGAPGYCDCG